MMISEELASEECWNEFYEYRAVTRHMPASERRDLRSFIDEKRYLPYAEALSSCALELPEPARREISKNSGPGKRVVYLYEGDDLIFLKMLAYRLSVKYDSLLRSNCYAFRRDTGACDAVRRIRNDSDIRRLFGLKTDLHDYFNSIPPESLMEKLSFLGKEDGDVYEFLRKMLIPADLQCKKTGSVHRGVMAGTPTSAFLANVYLSDLDAYFEKENVRYFRYSDDILIFAEDRDALHRLEAELDERISGAGLCFNASKRMEISPGEAFVFLGFSFSEGRVGMSEHSISKIKGRIRRKARALRRWAEKKNLPGDRAAKGFIGAMNRKFFDDGEEGEFSWSRWFFPNLTSGDDLKEIDEYMRKYARFCVTGRHYKGNYRISYETLKEWGFRSLVAEYYASKSLANAPR